jgi:hypothetical protein
VRSSLYRRGQGAAEEFGAHRGAYQERHLHRCDAFIRALLVFQVPETVDSITCERLVDRATNVVHKPRSNADALDAIHLHFAKTDGRALAWDVTLWFDHTKNYLVSKIRYEASGFAREEWVTRFGEPAAGVFFPERSEAISGSPEAPDGRATCELSNVKVNQQFSASHFELRYPPGVYLADSITRTRYQVDADGRQISKATAMDVGPPPPSIEESAGVGMTETVAEPWSWAQLLLPASFAILAIAAALGALKLWRRWRVA